MWVFEVSWEGDGEVWVIGDAEGVSYRLDRMDR